MRTFLGILLFILASGFQHDCHAYLASLKTRKPSPTSAPASPNPSSATASTYKLPEHPAFAYLIAPHYTAECLIYLALAPGCHAIRRLDQLDASLCLGIRSSQLGRYSGRHEELVRADVRARGSRGEVETNTSHLVKAMEMVGRRTPNAVTDC